MENSVIVTGRLKNIKEFNQYGLMMTGQLTQKDGDKRASFTIPIVTHDETVASMLRGLQGMVGDDGRTPELVITGEISTKFDLRQNVPNDQRRAPMTRIMVRSIELAQ